MRDTVEITRQGLLAMGSEPAMGRRPPIDGAAAAAARLPGLPEWIGLKWLMGLQGHRIDVVRLQEDMQYARDCLSAACCCADAGLRGYAQRLQQRLLVD